MGYEDFLASEPVKVAIAAVALLLALIVRRIVRSADDAHPLPSDRDGTAEILERLAAMERALQQQIAGVDNQAKQRGDSLARLIVRRVNDRFDDVEEAIRDHDKRAEDNDTATRRLLSDLLKSR